MVEPTHPWAPGTATGVGSMPLDDPAEAVRVVLGELPDFPHLPELPARGPGADLVGRAAALLVELAVDLQPSGWRLVDRAGVDLRRARDLLERDLDALTDAAAQVTGPLKVQVAGPWTLAAAVELPRGDKVLADPGALRDLASSLAEGVAAHVADVRRRLPAASIVLQLDEPSLPRVLAGRVPTASGFGALRAIPEGDAREVLREVVTAAGAPVVVHCCAERPPLELLADAGAAAVSFDATRLDPRLDDPLGNLVERGVGLFLGLVPALGPGAAPATRELAEPARNLWRRLGFPPERLPAQVVVTPACGLAGASYGWARTALTLARRVAAALAEAPEGVRT